MRGYPLFINGRAGSGKSTILQYLFTEYALDYLEHDWQTGEGEPAFFAANDLLIEASKTAVTELLMARLRGNERFGDFSAWMKPRQEAFDRLFKNLHSHLRSLLPPDRFPPDSLIDYAGFRAWWQSSFGLHPDARRYYNADISWHVIRSFIKGYDPESLLDPDGYKELPASQRTILQETFELVYERVWRAYKEHLSRHGLWDHQDLAREILAQNRAEPRHPALFCDEAQDFTRIELDLLYRLCLYTGRAIGWQDQSRIPIAFAGDPFQTLNPTGFRWDAIRAFYTERFIRAFPGQPRAEIQYHELRYNYRSNRRIVRFCNLIQLIRAAAFGHRNLLPQQAWEEEETNPPQVTFLDVTQPGVLENLKASPDIRIIVPCDEGDEIIYAAEHNLDRLVRRDDKGTPQNISSATRVKGLEFDRVALFGFGGACPQSFLDALRPETPHLEGDAAVEPEYFVNKLYVAASRPRKRLFIIDTPEAIERFWKGVFDERPFTSLISSPKFGHLSRLLEHWQGQTGFVVQGDPAQILTDQTEAAERLAARLERDGFLRKQAYPLRQAALYFEDAGDNKAALRCRALACEFEGEFLEAAALWKDFGDLEAAIRAAWQAGDGWARLILDMAAAVPRLQHDPRVRFAAFLNGAPAQPDPGAGLVLLRELRDALSQSADLLHEVLRVRQWRARIELAISRMRENRRQDGDTAIWKAIHSTLLDLGRHGIALAPETLGRAAFLGGLMKDAVAHWEQVPPRNRAPFERDLLRARAASADFPDNLLIYGELLSKSGQAADAQETVRAAADGDPQRLQPRHQKVLAEAWLILRDTSAVARIAEALDDLSLLCRAAETAASSSSASEARAFIRRITILLLQDARWRDLVAFLRDGILPARDIPENQTARSSGGGAPLISAPSGSSTSPKSSASPSAGPPTPAATPTPPSSSWKSSRAWARAPTAAPPKAWM